MIYSQHLNVSVQSARGTALVVIESSIFVLVNLAALVGNLVVCLVFYRSPSLRTVTNYFVISLALTDLLMSVLVMPLVVTSSIANEWITGQLGCKLMQVCGNALAGISVLTIMLLAVNRYFCVVRPTLYIYVFSKKRSIAMAVSVWIATIFAVLVQFVFTGMRFRTFTFQPTICFRDFPSTSSSIAYSTIQILYNSYSQFNHRSVLLEDLPNRSPAQYCSCSIVTEKIFCLWSGGKENHKNFDNCSSCFLPLLVASGRYKSFRSI